MKLYVNMVYEWVDQPSPRSIERLLWLCSDSPWVWTIKVYGESARPVARHRAELESALENGTAIIRQDPYAHLARSDGYLKESHRKYRDEAYDLIAPLVNNRDERIFHFYERNSPVTARIKSRGCSKSKMYRELRHFFQRGQIKNANLPLYDNCGWRNRLDEEDPKTARKKLGRPSTLSAATGELRGVNITKDILHAFRAGIKLFYLVRDKPPLRRAFQLTIERFFNCGYFKNRNGVYVPTLPPAEQLPLIASLCIGSRKSEIRKKLKLLVMARALTYCAAA